MAFKIIDKKQESVDNTIQDIKKAIELPSLQENKPKVSEVYEVVDTLPVQEIRRGQREDGVIVNFITKEEASEMINARTK